MPGPTRCMRVERARGTPPCVAAAPDRLRALRRVAVPAPRGRAGRALRAAPRRPRRTSRATPGAVAGRARARATDVRCHVVDHDHRPAEILVVREARNPRAGAARPTGRSRSRRRACRPRLAPRCPARAPVGVDGGVHDTLDAALALGADDDPAVAQRNPAAQELARGSASASRSSAAFPRAAAAMRRDVARARAPAPPRARATTFAP